MSWPVLSLVRIARARPQSGGSLEGGDQVKTSGGVALRRTTHACGLETGRTVAELDRGELESRVPPGRVSPVGGASPGGPGREPQAQRARPWGAESAIFGKGGVPRALGCGRGEPRRRLAEELDEAGLAVGLAGALLEGALGERAQAEGAGEVVWVEAAAQG